MTFNIYKILALSLTLATAGAWARESCEGALTGQQSKHQLQLSEAKSLGLRAAIEEDFTISRQSKRGSFVYLGENGKSVRDEKTLARIEGLKIRPDLSDVSISGNPRTYLQAWGFDERGRIQYVYHPLWTEVRNKVKYNRLVNFGEALPDLRENLNKDLRAKALTERKVLATMVKLIDETYIRVGNERYVEENSSYGLSTLLKKHVRVRGSEITFSFPGKSNQDHEHKVRNNGLAQSIRELLKLPGKNLFQFEDENGELSPVISKHVNDYIKEISGGDFTAKDFRTWSGTTAAAEYLNDIERPETEKEFKAAFTGAAEFTANKLQNTPAISRGSYIDPAIFEIYENESKLFAAAFRRAANDPEKAVLTLLKQAH